MNISDMQECDTAVKDAENCLLNTLKLTYPEKELEELNLDELERLKFAMKVLIMVHIGVKVKELELESA